MFDNYEEAIGSWGQFLEIHNCQFRECANSSSAVIIYIGLGSGNGTISNCSFINNRESYGQQTSIYMFFYTFGKGNFDVSNNLFLGYQEGVNVTLSPGIITIENNIFLNNLIPSPNVSARYLYLGTPLISVRNNLFEGNCQAEVVGGDLVCLDVRAYTDAEIYNNIFLGVEPGIQIWQHAYFGTPYSITVDHNAFWLDSPYPSIILREGAIGFPSNYDSLFCQSYQKLTDTSSILIDSGLCRDPMFVDTINYLLQAGSPLIDAGRPSILDLDGTRSDIGPFGGPEGQFYSYQDFPPQAPQGFAGTAQSSSATLQWLKNSESDLWYYALFKSTTGVIVLDSSRVLAYFIQGGDSLLSNAPNDSSFLSFSDSTFVPAVGARYTIVAVDSNGLISSPSAEVYFVGTDINDDEVTPLPENFELEQNFPNPFNANTAIVYSLPNIGAQPAEVRLIIYNSLGQEVRTLVNQPQLPGRQVAYWDGFDNSGNAVASGVYFYKLQISGADFIKSKKMILMK
ncbi:MAG: FlgD immunoglobulin-like domain containing protein [Candidatus Zixiibacteriota bacterium]